MRRMFLLTSILLLSATWALAQYSGGSSTSDQNITDNQNTNQGSSTSPSGTATSMSAKTEPGTSMRSTFEGCLSRSGSKYILKEKSGTEYELTGKTAGLKAHVGHTIEVTGTPSSAHKPDSVSDEQTNMEHQSLQVSSFRHVSGGCKGSMH
jgi:hypothetical protein